MTEHQTLAPPHPNLLVRWFVQYNPMFTASALCVLGGVFLLSRGWVSSSDGVALLTGVLEAYQWLVIGVAGLLYRRLLERRPAVFLGVMQLGFMIDPTLQLGALAESGDGVGSALWVVSFGLKWSALAWAFRLRLSTSARVVPVVGAAMVAALPNARLLGVDDVVLPALMAAGVFAVGLVVSVFKLRVESRTALGEEALVIFPRVLRAAVALGAVGALYQSWNAVLAAGAGALLPSFGAVLLVRAAITRVEGELWALVGGGLLLCHAGGVGPLVGLPLASIALLWAARTHAPRVLSAAVVVAYAAVVVVGPVEARSVAGLIVLAVLGSVPLGVALYTRRAWSAVPAILLMHARWTTLAGISVAPHGPAQWGLLLLGAGFVLLPAGVVLHRWLSRLVAINAAAVLEQQDVGPSTSVAVMSQVDQPLPNPG
ncbi:MAG: hypothetical protein Q8O67_23845 [Deltaproteobacteria bacterium]|nr:hypothetical protein [Deltaproteobacteria bacterium]